MCCLQVRNIFSLATTYLTFQANTNPHASALVRFQSISYPFHFRNTPLSYILFHKTFCPLNKGDIYQIALFREKIQV